MPPRAAILIGAGALLAALLPAPAAWGQIDFGRNQTPRGGKPRVVAPRWDQPIPGDVMVRLGPMPAGTRVRIYAWTLGGISEREVEGGGLGRARAAETPLRIPRRLFGNATRAGVQACPPDADPLDRSRCSGLVEFKLVAGASAAPAGAPGSIEAVHAAATTDPPGFVVRVSGSGVCDDLVVNTCHEVAGSQVCSRSQHPAYDLSKRGPLAVRSSLPGPATLQVRPGAGAVTCTGQAQIRVER